MTDYRHNRVPGGTFFFTVHLLDRNGTLLTDHFSAFGAAMRQARSKQPFHVDAWVVLPDHAHAIWTLPPGDHDCASRWRAVKIAFSKALRKAAAGPDSAIWEPHYRHRRVTSAGEYDELVDTCTAIPCATGCASKRPTGNGRRCTGSPRPDGYGRGATPEANAEVKQKPAKAGFFISNNAFLFA